MSSSIADTAERMAMLPADVPRDAVIVTRNLQRDYDMGGEVVRALRGVDLALYEGEFMVLLGPSGSGKSTLLNILGGLDVPTGGRVFYRGEELTAATEAELTRYRRYHVGFVFQFYNLIPSLTARENVALVTEIVPDPFAWHALAAVAWIVAFLPWVLRSTWIYLTPRADGREG